MTQNVNEIPDRRVYWINLGPPHKGRTVRFDTKRRVDMKFPPNSKRTVTVDIKGRMFGVEWTTKDDESGLFLRIRESEPSGYGVSSQKDLCTLHYWKRP